MKVTAAITAVSGYVPEYRLTNFELEKMVDTSDEWIRTRTGIKERRILKGPYGVSTMFERALKGLFAKTTVTPEEIELVICATSSPDYFLPPTAPLICDRMGMKNAWGYDVNAACSGFLFSLHTAASFIESGRYKKIIVLGGDKMSSYINYEDRNSCIIFGDGAGAVLLEPCEDGHGVIDGEMKVDGRGGEQLIMKGLGSKNPLSLEIFKRNEFFLWQDGRNVFKAAVKGMSGVTLSVMERNNLTGDDIRYLVPHQANLRIINATARMAGLKQEQIMLNIDKYGNTTNGTIPLCLWDWEKELKRGDNLMIAAFGGGFTWGAIYMKWAYDGAEVGK